MRCSNNGNADGLLLSLDLIQWEQLLRPISSWHWARPHPTIELAIIRDLCCRLHGQRNEWTNSNVIRYSFLPITGLFQALAAGKVGSLTQEVSNSSVVWVGHVKIQVRKLEVLRTSTEYASTKYSYTVNASTPGSLVKCDWRKCEYVMKTIN